MQARTGCTTRAARFLCRRPYCPGRGWGAGWRGRPDKTDKREVTRTTFPLEYSPRNHVTLRPRDRADAATRPALLPGVQRASDMGVRHATVALMLFCCPCTVSSGSIVSSSAAAARAGRPSILWATAANVGTGVPPWDGYVEQALAASFMNASTGLDPGFEMDFLDGLNDLNSSRLAHYDAVVLFVSPRALALLQQTSKEDLPSEVMLNATIERFVPTILDFANRGM